MDTSKHKVQELRAEVTFLRLKIKQIVKLVKNKPYAHNQEIFDISASTGIHENLL